jgi:hypothetical protein
VEGCKAKWANLHNSFFRYKWKGRKPSGLGAKKKKKKKKEGCHVIYGDFMNTCKIMSSSMEDPSFDHSQTDTYT